MFCRIELQCSLAVAIATFGTFCIGQRKCCSLTFLEGFPTNAFAKQVLGAAMFYVKVGDDSVVYTGDYNMTPDRHLGAAQIDPLEPDLLITE